MKKEMEYLRYNSFLNAISRGFQKEITTKDVQTQKKLLALTMKIIDLFSEIYGDHELQKASNHVSRNLAAREISPN